MDVTSDWTRKVAFTATQIGVHTLARKNFSCHYLHSSSGGGGVNPEQRCQSTADHPLSLPRVAEMLCATTPPPSPIPPVLQSRDNHKRTRFVRLCEAQRRRVVRSTNTPMPPSLHQAYPLCQWARLTQQLSSTHRECLALTLLPIGPGLTVAILAHYLGVAPSLSLYDESSGKPECFIPRRRTYFCKRYGTPGELFWN